MVNKQILLATTLIMTAASLPSQAQTSDNPYAVGAQTTTAIPMQTPELRGMPDQSSGAYAAPPAQFQQTSLPPAQENVVPMSMPKQQKKHRHSVVGDAVALPHQATKSTLGAADRATKTGVGLTDRAVKSTVGLPFKGAKEVFKAIF